MESAKKRLVLAVTLADHGGVQHFLAGFAVWLRDQGHEVTVVAGEGAWLAERCKDSNIPFIRLKKLVREIHPWKDLFAVKELHDIFRELKPDAVHLNSAKMSVAGSIASKLAKIPHVTYRIGGWTFREELPPAKKWLYRFMEKITARFKHVIVCVNPDDVRLAKEVGIKPRQEIIAVPNGIDLVKFDAEWKPIAHSHFTFGTIANFYPPKDLVRYLEACDLVHKAEPNARFVILGEGPLRKEIETKRNSLGLDEYVALPGAFVAAAPLLGGFDAFVLPSSKEGMAFALLEGMAAHLPCIATDVGAAKWMLADGGLIVPKMNPEALAEAMLQVMRDSDLRESLSKKARLQVETRFPLTKTYQGNLDALLN
jgi:glycosyltransferase involved in cell wall biosynthesis